MALAGVALETSFARFMASMAAFSAERVTSWRFDPRDFVSMVETCGGCGKAGCAEAVREYPSPDGSRRAPFRETPAPFGERAAFQVVCDRPITFVSQPTPSALPLVKVAQEKRRTSWSLFWSSQPCLALGPTPPVAPPRICQRIVHPCRSDIVEPHYNPNKSYSNITAEGKGGLERDEGCRSSPSEKSSVGVKIDVENLSGESHMLYLSRPASRSADPVLLDIGSQSSTWSLALQSTHICFAGGSLPIRSSSSRASYCTGGGIVAVFSSVQLRFA